MCDIPVITPYCNTPVQHPNLICVDLMMAHCQDRNMSSG
jgi:hypothetical protein